MCVSVSQVTAVCLSVCLRSRWSKQHVLVVYRPLASSLGLQLIVRVALRDDGSVGGRVAEQGPASHGLAPTQRGGGRHRGGVRRGRVGVRGRLGGGPGTGGGSAATAGGGAGGRGLTGAPGQAAVSQAGLRAPPVKGEWGEEGA